MVKFPLSRFRFHLLVLIALAILPSFALILSNGMEIHQLAAGEAQSDTKRSANQVASEFHRISDGARQLLTTLAQMPDIQTGNPASCNQMLRDIQRQFPQYDTLHLVDLSGTVICGTSQSEVSRLLPDREVIALGFKKIEFSTRYLQLSPDAVQYSLVFTNPVLTPNRELKYFVIALMGMEWLDQISTAANFPTGSTFTILDRDGRVLARTSEASRWIGNLDPDLPVIQQAINHPEGTYQGNGLDGIDRLFAYTRLNQDDNDFQASLVVGIPSQIAFAATNQLNTRNILSLCLVTFFSICAAWLGSDYLFLKKIKQIIQVIQRFSSGDMSARTRFPDGPEEIDYLGATFDKMADYVNQKKDEGTAMAETLRHSEKKFRTLAETAPAAIFIYSQEQFLYVNPAILAITGYAPDELIGMKFLNIVSPDDRELVTRRARDHQLNLPVPNRYEFNIIRKDGIERRVEFAAGLINYEGKPAVLGVALDVTDRYQAEEQLRLLSTAFESAANAMMITNKSGQIQWVNPAFTLLTGYSASEALGKNPKELVKSGIQDESYFQQLWHTILSGKVWHGYLTNRRKNNTLYIEEQTITPVVDAKGALQFFVSIKQDITDHRLREKEHEVVANLSTALRSIPTSIEMPALILKHLMCELKADGAALYFSESLQFSDRGFTGLGSLENCDPFGGAERSVWLDKIAQIKDISLNNQPLQEPFPNLLGIPVDPHARLAVTALKVDQKLIGAIWVSWDRPAEFPYQNMLFEEEKHVLNAIANIAANALHRATLHEKAEMQIRRLASLRVIDAAITNNLDIHLTMNTILREMMVHLNHGAVNIFTLNPALNGLHSILADGFEDPSLTQFKIQIPFASEKEKQLPAAVAFLEQRMVEINDIQTVPAPRAIALAQAGFRSAIVIPFVFKGQVKGMMELFTRARFSMAPEWKSFVEAVAEQAAIAIHHAELISSLAQSHQELSFAYDANIEGWSRALDLRDQETEGHSQRVTELTVHLAEKMGIKGSDLLPIRRGALLHDIGKMAVPDAILRKPGPLTPEEWEIMRQHPDQAYKLLSPITYMHPSLDIPYCHHEKWDGSGYPRRLKGLEIPLAARIFAIADVWDALRSDRPYRAAWPFDKTITYIQEQSGTHFDPDVVVVFLQMMCSPG